MEAAWQMHRPNINQRLHARVLLMSSGVQGLHQHTTANTLSQRSSANASWAEAPKQIARMTLTIKLDRNWISFQLANSAPPLSVTDSAIAHFARRAATACYQSVALDA